MPRLPPQPSCRRAAWRRRSPARRALAGAPRLSRTRCVARARAREHAGEQRVRRRVQQAPDRVVGLVKVGRGRGARARGRLALGGRLARQAGPARAALRVARGAAGPEHAVRQPHRQRQRGNAHDYLAPPARARVAPLTRRIRHAARAPALCRAGARLRRQDGDVLWLAARPPLVDQLQRQVHAPQRQHARRAQHALAHEPGAAAGSPAGRHSAAWRQHRWQRHPGVSSKSIAGRRPNNVTALPEASGGMRSHRAGTRYAQCALTPGGRWREHMTATEPVLRHMRARPSACTAPGRILAAARDPAGVAAACAGLSNVLPPVARALHGDCIGPGAGTARRRSASAALPSARLRRTARAACGRRVRLAPGGSGGRAAHLCDLRKRAAQGPPRGRPVRCRSTIPCRMTSANLAADARSQPPPCWRDAAGPPQHANSTLPSTVPFHSICWHPQPHTAAGLPGTGKHVRTPRPGVTGAVASCERGACTRPHLPRRKDSRCCRAPRRRQHACHWAARRCAGALPPPERQLASATKHIFTKPCVHVQTWLDVQQSRTRCIHAYSQCGRSACGVSSSTDKHRRAVSEGGRSRSHM